MEFKKLAVLSHDLPPSRSGQAIVLYNLFKSWLPDRYCLISSRSSTFQESSEKHPSITAMLLPATIERLPVRKQLPIPRPRLLSLVTTLINLLSEMFHRARRIKHVIEKEKCSGVLVCSGDLINIPAAHLACRLANTEYYIYLFDDYQFQWITRFQRYFASFMERLAVRNAKAIIAPNEFLAKVYQDRHGIRPIVIRNPTTERIYPVEGHVFGSSGPIRIGYTGSIYHAHYDAFQNLMQAISALRDDRIQLHVYTPQPKNELKKYGLGDPIAIHPPVSLAESLRIQSAFDILFLPLAFRSDIPEIIRTSSPGKLGEYLSSGTPMLVHAPRDSFISWYCRTHQCGLVVDTLDAEKMKDAIRQLCEDPTLRDKISANALERAKNDFSLGKISASFKAIFFGETAPG